jgi:Uma2 family endonuclease
MIVLDTIARSSVNLKMSFDDFLRWADEDIHAEWANGEVVLMSPASNRHQDISDFLTAILRIYTEQHDLGIVRSAPFQMKLKNSSREPDIVFVSKRSAYRLKETYLNGPADLAIEIISVESSERDRRDEFYEYQNGGVSEYWLIDPICEDARFFCLNAKGVYRQISDSEEIYQSQILSGFRLKLSWLWNIPPILQVLREMKILG